MSNNVWVSVYRDTIEEHDGRYNIAEVQVTEEFAKKYFNECVKPDGIYENFSDFWGEYTCDETLDFYDYAKKHNAVLDIYRW